MSMIQNTEWLNGMADQDIVNAILLRDRKVTQQYLYIRCYPLFKSVYDNYYTDCQSCMEFINEIYIHLLTPNAETGECKLQSFRFGSTLTTWLKTVAVFYCYGKYRKKKEIDILPEINERAEVRGDRFDTYAASMYEESNPTAYSDVETILSLMPNKRYSQLIRLRYVENMSNEETAEALGMSMDNFYNKHRRARIQFIQVLEKEQRYG